MAKITWTDSALDDLDEIAEYIALDKISAARKLVQRVFFKSRLTFRITGIRTCAAGVAEQ